ncbi:MAG: FtsX-like permease family protein, partial [Myxococcales bacterium]|nr:FtsX-like permease family protein [Myxococcales bacterium]
MRSAGLGPVRAVTGVIREDPLVGRAALLYAVLQLVLATWDLPSSWSWEVDAIAPRELFAGIGKNLAWGSEHRYPLFHYVLTAMVASPVILAALAVHLLSPGRDLVDTMVSAPVMTGIAVCARALTIAMSAVSLLYLARIARRTFDVRAGRIAIAFAVTNLTVGYYGRTINLDGPYLMWTVLAVDKLLTIGDSGSRRTYVYFGAFAAAAVATKDQAYASFILPFLGYLVVLPLVDRSMLPSRQAHAKNVGVAFAVGGVTLAALGGALYNPIGFGKRLRTMAGPASQDFRVYERSFEGVWANAADLALALDDFSWPWVVLSMTLVGLAISVATPGQSSLRSRTWRLLPAATALSSLLFFTLVVGRSEHRFVLPLTFWMSVYGGAAVSRSIEASRPPFLRRAIAVCVALALASAAKAPVALALTQAYDTRKAVETFLDTLPADATVESYGHLYYQPRFHPGGPYRAVHVHPTKAPTQRPPMPGVTLIQAPIVGISSRKPDVIVLPAGFSDKYEDVDSEGPRILSRHVARYQEDPAATEVVRLLRAGEFPGYSTSVIEPGAPSLGPSARAVPHRDPREHRSADHRGRPTSLEPLTWSRSRFELRLGPLYVSGVWMAIGEASKIGLKSLIRNPTRSGLTILGLAIGVAAFIAMVSFGQGARQSVVKQFESFGVNILTVKRHGSTAGEQVPALLDEEDVEQLRTTTSAIEFVVPIRRRSLSVSARGKSYSTIVHGSTPEFAEIQGWGFRAGGNFDVVDLRERSKVCILGETPRRELFGEDEALGEIVTVNQRLRCRVIGVLEPKGFATSGRDLDELMILPHTTYQTYAYREREGFDQIAVRPRSTEHRAIAEAEVRDVLRRTHALGDDRDDDFTIRSPDDATQVANSVAGILAGLLAGIAAVSLVVGGIGIMNIQLVAVAERTQEIGIRSAIGASPRQILLQFLLEAVLLALVGTVLGAILGSVVAAAVAGAMGWASTVPVQAVVVSMIFGAGGGRVLWLPAGAASLEPRPDRCAPS